MNFQTHILLRQRFLKPALRALMAAHGNLRAVNAKGWDATMLAARTGPRDGGGSFGDICDICDNRMNVKQTIVDIHDLLWLEK